MKDLVMQLEKIGQTSSIQQFQNLGKMANETGLDSETLRQIMSKSQDLICGLFPEDEDEE